MHLWQALVMVSVLSAVPGCLSARLTLAAVPVNCKVAAFTQWTACSAAGVKNSTATILQQPLNGGASCTAVSKANCSTTNCTLTTPCPVNCQVAASTWSGCTGGRQTGTMAITQQPKNGGSSCAAISGGTCSASSCTLTTPCLSATTADWDMLYDDDYIHFNMLIRISDWVSMAWGVRTMAAGQRVHYDKFGPLPYTSWRLMRDPGDRTKATDNTMLISTSVFNIVSRDGKLCWATGADGYMVLTDYATALRNTSLVRARVLEKHGYTSFNGKPVVRGMHWLKMRFDAPGGIDITPTDTGLVWKPMPSDPSYAVNRAAWEYGFEIQDVDWMDPTILH